MKKRELFFTMMLITCMIDILIGSMILTFDLAIHLLPYLALALIMIGILSGSVAYMEFKK